VREDGLVVDVALVHRRLSIIDHEGGHQPLVHDGTRLREDLTYQPGEEPKLAHELAPGLPLVAVVFNGCIYNHRELRKELEAKGHVFETDHSDTEVLVHGWRDGAFTMQDQLDAMYAGLLWNRPTGQLASLADNSGEKPIYQNAFGISTPFYRAYCTSPAGILRHQSPAEPLHEQYDTSQTRGLVGWIHKGFGYVPAAVIYNCSGGRWTICPPLPLQGCTERNPQIDLTKNPERSNHRTFRFPIRTDGGREFSTLTKLQHSLTQAIQTRLEADVPLGVFLSGGIDSGMIAAIAKKHRPDIKTFTVRMPDARIDESEAAGETARHLGTDHHTLDCDPHPADDLVHLIHQLGLPFGDSSLLPTYWVSKAAREHVKVALSGDGADELFGGYRRHTIAPKLNRWRHVLRLIPTGLLDRRTPGSRGNYLARLAIAARYGGYEELLGIFQSPDIRKLIPDIEGMHTGIEKFQRIDDPLRYDFTHYLPDDILRKTDTASMAVGLEVRAPFLARDLVEAALRTPLDVLMPGGKRKGLLKQVARKYLPDHIVDRPKQGFAIPIGEWFRSDYGKMRTLLYDHLESSDPFPGLADAGVAINMGFVRKMLREHDAAGEKSINPWHGRDHSQRLYMLLVLSIWAKWLAGLRGDMPRGAGASGSE